jgi:sugar phosphate isomerase/epimerase
MITRRMVLAGGLGLAASRAAPTVAKALTGSPWRAGVQLWMIRGLLSANLERGLARLAELGVREVETAGTFGNAARELRAKLAAAGIRAVSAHSLLLNMNDDEAKHAADYYHELGVDHVVAPIPGLAGGANASIAIDERVDAGLRQALSADVWRWNADRLNLLGQRLREGGLRIAYHNHNIEFARHGKLNGMELLLKGTEPTLVDFELDAGNARLAGVDPVDLLDRFPGRFKLAHLKAWRRPYSPRSTLDYPPAAPLASDPGLARLIRALRRSGLRHAFVEQEGLNSEAALAAIRDDLIGLASC